MQTTTPPALDVDLCRLVEQTFPREGSRRVVAEWLSAQYAESIEDVSKIDAQHWATLPGVLAANLRAAVEHYVSLARWRAECWRPEEPPQKTQATNIEWTPSRPRHLAPLLSDEDSRTLVDAVRFIADERDGADAEVKADAARVELPEAFVHALNEVSTFGPLSPAPTDRINEAIRLAPPEVLTPDGDVKVIVDTSHRVRLGMTLAWMRSGARADVGQINQSFRVEGLAAYLGERGEVDPCDDTPLVFGVNPTTNVVWSRVSAPLRGFARWLVANQYPGAVADSHELAGAFEPIGGEVQALAAGDPKYAVLVTAYLDAVYCDPGLPERLRAANYPLRATLRPRGVDAADVRPSAETPLAQPHRVTADDIDVLAMVLHRLYPTGPKSRLRAVVWLTNLVAPPTCAQWRVMLAGALRGSNFSPILWAATTDHPNDRGLLDLVARIEG